MRIVSLVPSQTELLYDLGLQDEVIGITKFCIHPEKWFRTKTRVGGTKTLYIEQIELLQPDLVIANKEENVKDQVDELSSFTKVYTSDISNLEDALQMIETVGKLVNKVDKAQEIILEIKVGFEKLKSTIQSFNTSTKTAYLIWKDPYMAAGGDTFINDMMERCGLQNVFKNTNRYPEVSVENLLELNCELFLLSSEPFPFKQKHINDLQKQLHGTKILLVDGEMFSWYGSRLVKSPGYFQELLQAVHSNAS